MGHATQTIKKQQRSSLGRVLQGLMLFGISVFAAVRILMNGLGDLTVERPGLGGKLNGLFLKLIERYPGAGGLLPYGMAALFGILALIGLYHVVCGCRKMRAGNTVLGQSVLKQQKNTDGFQNTVDAIDADLALEAYQFGTVYIGRYWIVDIQAMRLQRIRGVFRFETGMEEHILCCVDEAKNVWVSSLRYSKDRDNAMEHLKQTLPDLVTGDKDAFNAFLTNG